MAAISTVENSARLIFYGPCEAGRRLRHPKQELHISGTAPLDSSGDRLDSHSRVEFVPLKAGHMFVDAHAATPHPPPLTRTLEPYMKNLDHRTQTVVPPCPRTSCTGQRTCRVRAKARVPTMSAIPTCHSASPLLKPLQGSTCPEEAHPS